MVALSSVIGFGEIGKSLFKVLSGPHQVETFDKDSFPSYQCELINICFPYSETFNDDVLFYVGHQHPKYIVIHSSVPVGTTKELNKLTGIPVFHSPVRGKHPDITDALRTYVKYLSYEPSVCSTSDVDEVSRYFSSCDMSVKTVEGTEKTELMKLLELSRYGVYLAFAKEQEAICKRFGLSYDQIVTEYDTTRNDGLEKLKLPQYKFPLLTPFVDYVGGHCTVEDMKILLDQYETPMLKYSYELDRGTVIWGNANVYKTAKVGKGCSIGFGSEVGHNVVIGDRVRIGAMCFIPEGVTIEDDVFIAPKVTFSNDKHPPSGKSQWGKIHVGRGAVLGMGSIILPDVTIGEHALIGAGSIVTKDVPPSEVWFGVASTSKGKRNAKSIGTVTAH